MAVVRTCGPLSGCGVDDSADVADRGCDVLSDVTPAESGAAELPGAVASVFPDQYPSSSDPRNP